MKKTIIFTLCCALMTMPLYSKKKKKTPSPLAQKSSLTIAAEQLAKKIQETFKARIKESHKNNFAIFEFTANSKEAEEKGIGKTMSDLLTSQLKKTGEFDIVDRDSVQKAMDEMALGLSGMVDESTANEVGAMVAANLFLSGSVGEAGNNYITTIKVTHVETGTIILTEDIEFRLAFFRLKSKPLASAADRREVCLQATSSVCIKIRAKKDASHRRSVRLLHY